jgi:hypothetical protein
MEKRGGEVPTFAAVFFLLPLNEVSPLHIQEVSAAIKVTIEPKKQMLLP